MTICHRAVSRGARYLVARVGGVGGETVVRVGGVGGETVDRDNLLRSCQQRSQISSCQGWWCGWGDCCQGRWSGWGACR